MLASAPPCLGDEVEHARDAVVDVRRVHRQHAARRRRASAIRRTMSGVSAVRSSRSSPGTSANEALLGQEVQHAARLHPVLLGVAVQLHDAVDRRLVAEERERRDERAGADAGHDVELRLGQRVVGGHAAPALEEPGAERAPVPAAGDDQDVDDRRVRPLPRRVGVLLGFSAIEQFGKDPAEFGREALVAL